METILDMLVSVDQIKTWMRKDPTLSRVMDQVLHGWSDRVSDSPTPYYHKILEFSVQDHCLLWGKHVIIPKQGQKIVLSQLHAAHPRVMWIKRFSRVCVVARSRWANWGDGLTMSNVQKPTKSPCIPDPTHPVAIATMGPGSCWLGRTFSRTSIPGPNGCAYQMDGSEYIAICYFRVYHKLPEKDICHIWNTKGISYWQWLQFHKCRVWDLSEAEWHLPQTSASYHPASNRLTERVVQTFKHGLASLKEGTIQMRLSHFLFAYCNTLHGTTGVSPGELMIECKPWSSMDLLNSDLRRKIDHQHQQQIDPAEKLCTFNVQEAVMLR